MSYNGSGTFNINTAGQPVVDGTVISSSVFNALTADLGTGLTTAITKDGQTTPTANIPLGTFKITGLGAGTAATDAVRMSQLQAGGTTFLTAAGTDTITATASPALTAYATGNLFTFVVAVTNTGAVTLNIDGLGAKAVTRDGTTALAANDLVATEVVIVGYDGTRFQVLNPNAATNYRVSGTLGVTGVATMTAAPVFSSATASQAMFTDGSKALVSNAITGTGNVVMSASPTLTGTIGAASQTLSGSLTVGTTLGVTGASTIAALSATTGSFSSTLGVTGVSTFAAGSAAAPSITTTGDTNTGVFFPAADTIGFSEGGAEAMRIDSSGNLGIGTSSPAYKLEVRSTMAVLDGSANIGFWANGTTYTQVWQTLQSVNDFVIQTAASKYMSFGTNSTERMRIDTSGNLGIGTSSPVAKLQIKGSGTSGQVTASWILENASSGTAGMDITGTAGASRWRFLCGNGPSTGTNTLTESMCILTEGTGAGNVLVGKTASGSEFTVAGTQLDSDGGTYFCRSGNPAIHVSRTTSDGAAISFFRGSGTTVGNIAVTTTATAYNTSSDYRLKNTIAPMTGALAKVALLKPCTYKWKVDGSAGEGFIAHELQEVAPYAVTGEKDGKQMQGVDYGKLTPILTAALQEAIAKIETLEARIAALEAK